MGKNNIIKAESLIETFRRFENNKRPLLIRKGKLKGYGEVEQNGLDQF